MTQRDRKWTPQGKGDVQRAGLKGLACAIVSYIFDEHARRHRLKQNLTQVDYPRVALVHLFSRFQRESDVFHVEAIC